MNKKMNLAILIIIQLTIEVKSVEQVKTETDFFNNGFVNKHLVVGFFNKETQPLSEETMDYILETLEGDEYFKDQKFKFVKADVKDFKNILDHYKVEGHLGLFYYIENQLQEFKEMGKIGDDYFSKKIDKSAFLLKAHTYLMEKHSRVGKELTSVEEFENQLNNFKTIGVYFGLDNLKNEAKFDKLAHKHIHFHFFKIKNSELAKAVYQRVMKSKYDGSELLLIIRHKESLNMFDNKEGVLIDMNFNYKRLTLFLMYEGQKKLKHENEGVEIFMDVFHKEAKLILYVYNPSTPDSEREAFEEAVERLPKGTFYASINSHDRWVGNYLQIFHMAEQEIKDNTLYFIFGAKSQFIIKKFDAEMTAEGIEEAVRHVVKKNYDYFNTEEREQFEELAYATRVENEEL